MRKIVFILAFAIVAGCVSDPKVNPNINGGSAGAEGDSKINCVSKGGLLVSKKGGGWWCKINNQLLSLNSF